MWLAASHTTGTSCTTAPLHEQQDMHCQCSCLRAANIILPIPSTTPHACPLPECAIITRRCRCTNLPPSSSLYTTTTSLPYHESNQPPTYFVGFHPALSIAWQATTTRKTTGSLRGIRARYSGTRLAQFRQFRRRAAAAASSAAHYVHIRDVVGVGADVGGRRTRNFRPTSLAACRYRSPSWGATRRDLW